MRVLNAGAHLHRPFVGSGHLNGRCRGRCVRSLRAVKKYKTLRKLTCCIERYPAAKHVWMEYAVSESLHILQGPMTVCNQPNAGETRRLSQTLQLDFTAHPQHQVQLHALLSVKYV